MLLCQVSSCSRDSVTCGEIEAANVISTPELFSLCLHSELALSQSQGCYRAKIFIARASLSQKFSAVSHRAFFKRPIIQAYSSNVQACNGTLVLLTSQNVYGLSQKFLSGFELSHFRASTSNTRACNGSLTPLEESILACW